MISESLLRIDSRDSDTFCCKIRVSISEIGDGIVAVPFTFVLAAWEQGDCAARLRLNADLIFSLFNVQYVHRVVSIIKGVALRGYLDSGLADRSFLCWSEGHRSQLRAAHFISINCPLEKIYPTITNNLLWLVILHCCCRYRSLRLHIVVYKVIIVQS